MTTAMDAVLLAGGRGTRLAPLTVTVPKPLLPLGERPIIDVLITQLAAAGVKRVFVCLGYLAPLMMAFLGDGGRWGVTIEPRIEAEPLGTAGGLRAVDGLTDDFFVVNGDTLTDLDFRAMAAAHRAADAWATLFTPFVDEKVDYGVVSIDGEGAAHRLPGETKAGIPRELRRLRTVAADPAVDPATGRLRHAGPDPRRHEQAPQGDRPCAGRLLEGHRPARPLRGRDPRLRGRPGPVSTGLMRVLVTGAGGFLGGAIRQRLAARDDVQLVDGVGRLDDRDALAQRLRATRPDVVVHAAGRTQGSARELQADNVAATEILGQAIAAAAPDCGLVLLGSAAQYGRSADRTPWKESTASDPVDPYGRSKLAAETAAFAATGRVLSLRLFNVVAPGAHGGQAFPSFLRRLAAAMAQPPPWRVEMGRLTAIRDFIALDDVLGAVERAIDAGAWGEAINVCSGVGRPVRSLLEDVSRLVAGKTPGMIVIAESGPPPTLDWSVGDPAKCQARLGFTPSSDLSTLTTEAAAWVRRAAAARADA